jgi:ribonuclease D
MRGMQMIATQAELEAFCVRQSGAEFLAVDTEFMRERTYWPQLCLMQIAGPDEAAAIDALANLDLKPVFELLNDTRTLKVMHAARQDLEIFVNIGAGIPAPLFDTQIAAMVCGFGESVGYETLAGKLAGAKLDKSSRFTDWMRRPLTDRQIRYAIEDVTHLRRVYQALQKELQESGRVSWLLEEEAILLEPTTYRVDPREVWRRLKVRQASPVFLAILRELAEWREIEAQRRNVPRNRVIRDEALLELAAQAPTSAEDLSRMRALPKGYSGGRDAAPVLAAVERGRACPPADMPEPPERRNSAPHLLPVVELLKVLLKMASERAGVAPRIVASSDELERIAAETEPDVPALRGWRRELFGESALALKAGNLALALGNNGVRAVPVENGRAADPRAHRQSQRKTEAPAKL